MQDCKNEVGARLQNRMSEPVKINTQLFDELMERASRSPRLRMNYNLHESLDAGAQRLLNALLPGTVLPIHRHPHTAETYIVLRGKLTILFYNEHKEEIARYPLAAGADECGLQIPAGTWHTVEVQEPTIILEVKDGPYKPLNQEDIL